MRLRIIQLNYGPALGGGSATVHLDGQKPTSAFDQRPYLSLTIGFTLHNNRPEFNPDNQELISLQAGPWAFIRVGFIQTQSNPVSDREEWPNPLEYRNKVARLIANMVSNAELLSLDDAVPSVICA